MLVMPSRLSKCAALALVLACAAARADDGAAAAFEAGIAAQRDGRHADAAAAFERVVAAEPTRVEAWSKLAAARSSMMSYDAAIQAYQRIAELEPGNPKHWNNLANAYYRKGDYETAAQDYARAVELDPQYVLGQFHYGWTLRDLNRSEEAEKAFRACTAAAARDDRERKTQIDCLFGIGSLRHRAGDYAAAAKLMEQVLAVFPGHPEARYYLAMSYRQLGRVDDAERELKTYQLQMGAQRHAAGMIEKSPEP
jgi:tetratricopeptide (TPR) repeat protein